MHHPITVVEFCAGYCGLGLGLQKVLGDRMRTIGYCELEGFAQANLVSKMEAGLLDAAPLWPDLRTFPYDKFRGLVDFAIAGIPCQPHSTAGKRAGGSDDRFLFDEWLAGLERMRPGFILIENVEGLLHSKMPDGQLCIAWTVERLEGMGYAVEAGIFSAAEVGAPHPRKRVFLLAHCIGTGLERHTGYGTIGDQQGWVTPEQDRSTCSSSVQPWPSGPSEPQHEWEPPRTVGDTNGTRLQKRERQRKSGLQRANTDGGASAGRETEPALGGDSPRAINRMDDAIVFASDCRPCECCDDVICWRCQEHYADCPCPGPNSSDD